MSCAILDVLEEISRTFAVNLDRVSPFTSHTFMPCVMGLPYFRDAVWYTTCCVYSSSCTCAYRNVSMPIFSRIMSQGTTAVWSRNTGWPRVPCPT